MAKSLSLLELGPAFEVGDVVELLTSEDEESYGEFSVELVYPPELTADIPSYVYALKFLEGSNPYLWLIPEGSISLVA